MTVLSAIDFVTQGFTSGRVRSLANTMERLAGGYPKNDPQKNVNLQNARTLRQRAREMDRLVVKNGVLVSVKVS